MSGYDQSCVEAPHSMHRTCSIKLECVLGVGQSPSSIRAWSTSVSVLAWQDTRCTDAVQGRRS